MFYVIDRNDGFKYLKEAIEELRKHESALLIKSNEDRNDFTKIGSVENGKARY